MTVHKFPNVSVSRPTDIVVKDFVKESLTTISGRQLTCVIEEDCCLINVVIGPTVEPVITEKHYDMHEEIFRAYPFVKEFLYEAIGTNPNIDMRFNLAYIADFIFDMVVTVKFPKKDHHVVIVLKNHGKEYS